jgi:exopolyphosphatase / guanosine-5'-triphosphate,3'-diphosphate pyrophosphatase
MSDRIAIIDMGTNTFHLLLAEPTGKGGYAIVHRDRIAVKIGKGGINHGYITPEGIDRAVRAMQNFKNTIHRQGIKTIHAFGTSALRSASNCSEVLERIKKATGIDAKVILGDIEAEYIYYGVRSSLAIGPEKCLIVDIGGGSVEFIIGDETIIFWKESVEIGAQRLLEQFHNQDPISLEEIQILNKHFDKKLGKLFKALERFPTTVLIGASGTFDTLSDIYCNQQSIQKGEEDPETPLTLEGFYHIYDELTSKTRAQRMQIPGMIEMRVDMIVVACCLVRFILSRHRFDRIRVSSYSLKEGVLASFNQPLRSGKTSMHGVN